MNMLYPKLLICVVLVSAVVVAASISHSDGGTMQSRMSAEAGKSFTIVLPSNPTTGYSWAAKHDPDFLKLEDSHYVGPGDQIPGKGGEQVFSFLPLKKGQTVIVFKYRRPWEPDPVQTQKYIVTIGK